MDARQALMTLDRTLPHLHIEVDQLIKQATATDAFDPKGAIDGSDHLRPLRDRIVRRLRTLAKLSQQARRNNAHASKRSNRYIPGAAPVKGFDDAMRTFERRLIRVRDKLALVVHQPPVVERQTDTYEPFEVKAKGKHGATIKHWEKFAKTFIEQPDSPMTNPDLVIVSPGAGPGGLDPFMVIAMAYSVINLMITNANAWLTDRDRKR